MAIENGALGVTGSALEDCHGRRVDELLDHADAWRQSKNIRGYLGAACDMLLERDGAISTDGQAAEYLRWARDQADRLDPLLPSPPSVLDERI